MSDPIKVGDLVMQVRACCDSPLHKTLGMIGTVNFIGEGNTLCGGCGFKGTGIHVSCRVDHRIYGGGVPVSWVKKIDPPQLSENEKRDEEITA